jgi:hypothetical protein
MPLLAFSPTLWMARWRALPQYASLAGAQGRLVQRAWIDEEKVDSALLEPAGMGVMADMASVYEAIAHMRWLPLRRETVVAILLPMAVPFLLLVLLSMPLREILATLMSVLK